MKSNEEALPFPILVRTHEEWFKQTSQDEERKHMTPSLLSRVRGHRLGFLGFFPPVVRLHSGRHGRRLPRHGHVCTAFHFEGIIDSGQGLTQRKLVACKCVGGIPC